MYSKNCKLVLLDEVNCIFSGLHPDHVLYFYELYGFYANSYFFNPKFQLGVWDGKIRFFQKNGKTFINLLSEIVPKVKNLGYKITMEDRRSAPFIEPTPITKDFFSHIIDPEKDAPWEVRDYQVDMVNLLLKNGGGVGIAGTGAGKTSMCAALALSYENAANFRSIIVVPDTTLTVQTIENYKFFELDVGEFTGRGKDLEHKHVVSTWQTLQNHPYVISQFDMVIVDECQGIRGATLTKLLLEDGKNIPYRFGVTGSLPENESDQTSIRVAVGDVQCIIPAHELIEQGHLSNLGIEVFQLKVDLMPQYKEYLEDIKNEPHIKKLTYNQFKEKYFPDFTSERSFLNGEKSRLDWITRHILNLSMLEKGNVLCLVSGVKFGKKLAKLIPNSVFVHGADDVEDRRAIYETFKDNDNVIVIATVNIAGTGLDIKRIFNLVLIDIGKSFIRVIQAIGRGLRKAHDKDFVHISDICSDLKYSKRHATKRIKYYNEAKYPNKKIIVDY